MGYLGEESGGSIQPLGSILTFVPGPGNPDSATQSYAADFSCGVLSSPIWAAVCYPGEGEYFHLYPGSMIAHPSLELDMRQAYWPAYPSPGFGLHS